MNIIIKEEDVIETKHDEGCILIKVKYLEKLNYVNAKCKLSPKDWREFWADFVTDFLSQEFLNGRTKEQKKEMTEFIKDKLKHKFNN